MIRIGEKDAIDLYMDSGTGGSPVDGGSGGVFPPDEAPIYPPVLPILPTDETPIEPIRVPVDWGPNGGSGSGSGNGSLCETGLCDDRSTWRNLGPTDSPVEISPDVRAASTVPVTPQTPPAKSSTSPMLWLGVGLLGAYFLTRSASSSSKGLSGAPARRKPKKKAPARAHKPTSTHRESLTI